MKPKKTESFTLRLDADLLARIETLAGERHTNRTTVITGILHDYFDTRSEAPETLTAQPDKLDQVIALLGTISGQLAGQAKPAPVIKPERTAPATQSEAPQRIAVQNGDPRFVVVPNDADKLIVSMTQQRGSLEDIVGALNAAGYLTATGQEWTRSRLRDYRHKLRDRGLLNG